MNCPSRVDNTLAHEGWNQNPPTFAADTTTRQDLNGISNSRAHQDDAATVQIDPAMLQESEMSKPGQVSQRNAYIDEIVLISRRLRSQPHPCMRCHSTQHPYHQLSLQTVDDSIKNWERLLEVSSTLSSNTANLLVRAL
jgi:hypothetical protein